MSDSTTTLVAAGWYPDPENPADLRWWDSTRWTEHTMVAPVAEPVPFAPSAFSPEAAASGIAPLAPSVAELPRAQSVPPSAVSQPEVVAPSFAPAAVADPLGQPTGSHPSAPIPVLTAPVSASPSPSPTPASAATPSAYMPNAPLNQDYVDQVFLERQRQELEAAEMRPTLFGNPLGTATGAIPVSVAQIYSRDPYTPPSGVPAKGNTPASWFLAFSWLWAAALGAAAGVLLALVIGLPVPPEVVAIAVLAVYLIGVLIAVGRDRSTLLSRGYSPPSFAWILLTIPGYLIARAIVVHRQGGKAIAPLVAYVVSSFVLGAISTAVSLFGLAHLPGVDLAPVAQSIEAQELAKGQTWLVECPTNVPLVQAGTVVTCQANAVPVQHGIVTVTFTDAQGHFGYVLTPDAALAG